MNKYIEKRVDIPDEFVLKINKLSKVDFECDYLDGLGFDETESKNVYNNRLRPKNIQTLYLVDLIDKLTEKLMDEKREVTKLNLEIIDISCKAMGINAIPLDPNHEAFRHPGLSS